jgi:hypothetical protein
MPADVLLTTRKAQATRFFTSFLSFLVLGTKPRTSTMLSRLPNAEQPGSLIPFDPGSPGVQSGRKAGCALRQSRKGARQHRHGAVHGRGIRAGGRGEPPGFPQGAGVLQQLPGSCVGLEKGAGWGSGLAGDGLRSAPAPRPACVPPRLRRT